MILSCTRLHAFDVLRKLDTRALGSRRSGIDEATQLNDALHGFNINLHGLDLRISDDKPLLTLVVMVLSSTYCPVVSRPSNIVRKRQGWRTAGPARSSFVSGGAVRTYFSPFILFKVYCGLFRSTLRRKRPCPAEANRFFLLCCYGSCCSWAPFLSVSISLTDLTPSHFAGGIHGFLIPDPWYRPRR